MNSNETAGTLQRTPAGDDSEFQRDSNATFAIGNSLALGHANPKDISTYLKHSTTFKEFLAWREARKLHSNTDSLDNRPSRKISSDPATGHVQTEKRALGNRSSLFKNSGAENGYNTVQKGRENIEEKSDDFEFYKVE